MRNLLLFLLVCIPVRLLIAFLAWKSREKNTERKALAAALLVMGAGMIFNGYQRKTGKKANKGFLNGEAYWDSFLHGSLYISASFLLFAHPPNAWVLLLADTVIGFATAANHYWAP